MASVNDSALNADLVTRSTQSCLQLRPLLLPSRVLRLRPFVECSAIFFNLVDLAFVLLPGVFKHPFCLRN
jgi:hypothetical protein